MSERTSPEAALKRLVLEARTDRPANVDFKSIEQRLLLEVRRAAPPPVRPSSPLLWLSLAAAAGAALWLVARQMPTTAPAPGPALVDVAEALERSGDELAVGTRVTTAARALTVAHAGRATWSLAPNSSALLAEKGERITVHLERGSVLSDVVPSSKPETFVVETSGARVAVHGTLFRVSLEGGRVSVQVREGVVAVGPREGAPAFLLKAPAYGDFAADGLSGSIDGKPSNALAARSTEPLKLGRFRGAASAGAPASAAPASPSAELPQEPSINDIESGITHSVDVASDCFRRHTQSADGVQVTVRTALSLELTGAGQAINVQFQPPLSPDAEACAVAAISSIAFAPSERGAKVTRMLELKR